MSATLKIKIFDPQGTHLLQIAKSSLTIGSAPHCDVVVAHPSVQPEHTRAWIEGGRIWIQDLASPSGTALNEIRLPELKPMLVRDLDILRLGQSESTMSLEAILVRAPTFKKVAQAPSPSTPPKPVESKLPTRDAEAEKRREEIALLSRDLAELRLQLQMAQLEKNSAEEMAQQIQNLRVEIEEVQEQKAKWNTTLQEIEKEKNQIRSAAEVEIAEFKGKYAQQMKLQMDQDLSRLGEWKKESVPELIKAVRVLTGQKTKSWSGRVVAPDLMFEWEEEMTMIFRRLLLKEKVVERTPQTPVAKSPAPPVTTTTTTSEREMVSETAKTDTRRLQLKVARSSEVWKSRGVKAFMGLLLIAAIGITYQRLKSHPVSGFTSQSSEAVENKQKARFSPKQNRKFRQTYTDNVLYLENYVAAEQNRDFRKLWQQELHRVATAEWKADAHLSVALVNREQVLVMDLNHLRDNINAAQEAQGIAQMRLREAQFLREIEALMKGRAGMDRFLKFKRAFFVKNQTFLTAEKR